jgi:hypothetical protein
MGNWGVAVFQDDVACDVRDTYTELLSLGVADDAMLQELQATFGGATGIDASTFWIALALSQHRVGRLRDDVLRRACEYIETGQALADWAELTEPGDPTIAARGRALQKALDTLGSKQPARKSPRPSKALRERIDRHYEIFPWAAGELWAWRRTRGDVVVLAVASVHLRRLGRHYRSVGAAFVPEGTPELREPCLLLMDWCAASAPSAGELDAVSPYVTPVTASARAEAERADDAVRAVWTAAATRTFEEFVDETRDMLGHFSDAQLRARHVETVAHARDTLEAMGSRDEAVDRRFHVSCRIDPREPVPVDRLTRLDASRRFATDCADRHVGWSTMSDRLDALAVGSR